MRFYSKEFFKGLDGTHTPADIIVPIVVDLVAPKSVVDIGCGTGVWLATFLRHGTQSVLGIDGPWVPKKLLEIPQDSFLVRDLEKPLDVEKKFDLVVSLEVAEHVASSSAVQFVETLTSLGDVVLFSAAVPNQGGTHHINEQWQGYWIDLFGKKDFVVVDAMRRNIWNTPGIPPYYKQNMLFFVNNKTIGNYPKLVSTPQGLPASFPIVHPDYTDPTKFSLRRYLEKFPTLAKSFLKRKMKRD